MQLSIACNSSYTKSSPSLKSRFSFQRVLLQYQLLKPHLTFPPLIQSLEEIPQIILSESAVEIADDYTKRKNVFRLKTEAGSEVLFQADNEVGLTQWVHAVEAAINAKDRSGSQRKLTSVTSHRNRSPTGQSPASKNRKASAGRKMFHS